VQVAVVGIGQSMRGDDAAGLEAVRLWQRSHARTAGMPDLRVAMAEEPGLDLLDLFKSVEAAILVDAVRSGAKAGRIHRIGVDALSDFRRGPEGVHSWTVAQLLRLDGVLNPLSGPRQVKLVGIEAAAFDIGTGLSEAVRVALPEASDAIEQEVLSLLQV